MAIIPSTPKQLADIQMSDAPAAFPKTKTSAAKRYEYPSKLGQAGRPYVLFTRHKPQYDSSAGYKSSGGATYERKSDIALYIPLNMNVSDQADWQDVATGLLGAGVGAAMNDNKSLGDLIPSDFGLDNPDVSAMLNKAVPALTTAAGAALGKVFGSAVGGAAGGVGVADVVQNEAYRASQTVLNPRQFGIFKAPMKRGFSFNFRFVPENLSESNAVRDIIKEFRTAMYPELTATGLAYTFPDAFTIRFMNVGDGMVKLPECVVKSATVSYNPNAMSFFTKNKHPVEVNFDIQLQELQPIHRQMVEDGF